MTARYRSILAAAALAAALFVAPARALACGHDGFYIGAGYTQLFMLTTEHRLGNTGQRINFGPGFGANALVGYDFCGSRWGIQLPFEFTRLKLNKSEWVNQFGSSIEGVLHLVEWPNGLDVHLLAGAGWTYITEGQYDDRTAAAGLTVSAGPGLSYYFSRTETLSAALALELPFRWIYYFGSHLSSNGTSIVAFPVRLSIQVGF